MLTKQERDELRLPPEELFDHDLYDKLFTVLNDLDEMEALKEKAELERNAAIKEMGTYARKYGLLVGALESSGNSEILKRIAEELS